MMKEIKTRREYELVDSIRDEVSYIENMISGVQEESPELLNPENLQALNKIKTECEELLASFNETKIGDLLSLIKTGNTILIETTDAISYSENQYYHVVDQNPDWRDMIKFSLVKVGHGDTGDWISYDETYFIKSTDLINLLKTYKHSLVDFEVMDKYIQFTKTIPE